jgi:C1A family cysteine protease
MALNRKLLHKFQPVDSRDYIYVPKAAVPAKNSVDLRPTLPGVLDQGNIGTCVSNAFAFAILAMTKKNVMMSRLMHYAVTRCICGYSLSVDSGLYIRDAAKSIASNGVGPETSWVYDVTKFSIFPSCNAFKSANLFKTYTYTFVNQDVTSLKNCLNEKKVPIIFGFVVYTSFMTQAVANSGVVPMPNTKIEKPQGGHCTCIVGYDDTKQVFICANSWGAKWGDKGYFYIPFEYITNASLSRDFCYLNFTY